MVGLLDSGASCSILGIGSLALVESLGLPLKSTAINISTADGTHHPATFYVEVPVTYVGKTCNLSLLVIPTMTKELILGMDFWNAFNVTPQIAALKTEDEGYVSPLEHSHELSNDQTRALSEAVNSFAFSTDNRIGFTAVVEHSIDTGEAKPIKQRQYTVSPYLQTEIDQEIDRMLVLDIIEPATSPWSNPMVAARKANGKLRYCLDARKLNSVTVPEAFPIPDLNRILGRLRSTRYLSSIDLSDAFWQVGLKPEDRPKTAFAVSGRGFFMFKRMPFGLTNSPATLCRLVEMVVGCDLEPWVFKYLDDFIVATDTFERHVEVLETLAKRLKDNGLTISAKKSCFCMKQLRYVGYLLTEEGLAPDPEKTSAVLDYPAPTNMKEVRRFMGMAGWYRRFIHNFSTVSAPITALLRTKTTKAFHWDVKAQEAFDELKRQLVQSPVLANPDFTRPFTVQTDASDLGVGAVLTQGEGADERVIAYFSKKLSRAQQKYMVTERECLAVILALEKFRCYVEGIPFKVVTDHASLCWLQNLKDPAGRLARWAIRLQPFQFKFVHRPGRQLVVPDALSRSIALVDVSSHTGQDEWFVKLRNQVEQSPDLFPNYRLENGVIQRFCARGPNEFAPRWKIVVPKELRESVLNECHDNVTAAHGGFFKTIGRIRRQYFWPGLAADVRKYVRSCVVCKKTKPPNEAQRALMGKPRDTDRPWRVIGIDYIGPFPLTKRGNQWLFVVTDTFSKFVCLHAMKKSTAPNTIDYLRKEIFLRFGVPEAIILDNGPQLRSKQFHEFAEQFKVKLWYNAVYHPQANPTEAANATVVNAIRAYITDSGDHRSWDVHLAELQCALNSAPHTSTSQSPHFVLYGTEIVMTGDEYAQHLVVSPENRTNLFSKIRSLVSEKLQDAYEKREKRYNLRARPIAFARGDQVFRRNFVLSNAGKRFCAKLAPKFVPAVILERVGSNCYRLAEPDGKPLPGTYSTADIKR